MCGYANGTSQRKARSFIQENGLDISHFGTNTKYKTIKKECPVCGIEFETKKGHSKEKQTCGYACSNTYFRSGENHGNWKEVPSNRIYGYRKICFAHHEQRCVICGEERIVSVHHLDENHHNNDPKNLIPLCPTHHLYWHSQYRELIESQILDYVSNKWSERVDSNNRPLVPQTSALASKLLSEK